MVSSVPVDASEAVADFWARIREDDISAVVASTRSRLMDLCPAIDTFSFEMVDDTQVVGPGDRESPVTSVELGTPRPVVDAWNQTKLVGLVVLESDQFCGAAVGNDVPSAARDFKACCLPTAGETKCRAGNHVGPKVKRMPFPSGTFIVAIPTSLSTGGVKQVFSRPVLQEEDFFYMPLSSFHFKRLLTLRMEPRVFKALFELFPGPHCLAEPTPVLSAPPKRSGAVGFATPSQSTPLMQQLVSDKPILSPEGKQGIIGQSFQPAAADEGWNFEEDEDPLSQDLPLSSNVASDPTSSDLLGDTQPVPFAWEDAFNPSRTQALTRSHSSESIAPSASSNEKESLMTLLRVLQSKVENLETKEKAAVEYNKKKEESLTTTFKALADENKVMMSQLQDAKHELFVLKHRRGPPSSSTLSEPPLSDRQRLAIVAAVERDLNLSQYVTHDELNRATQSQSRDSDLLSRLKKCEAELFEGAGSISQLIGKVETLEAARAVTAVEIGGFVFTNEEATEAWAQSHADKDLHRFVPDFLSYFLLADPKFETVEGGLSQMASVAKAQFSSLDLATIDLSYAMTYPPKMLKSSDKEEAQLTDGIWWAPQFASHAVFEGNYNNGSHLKVKRSLNAVSKAMEAGIDYHFPAAKHPKSNAVFKDQARLAAAQCLDFLDSLTPLYKQISGGGMSSKEAWSRCMVFAKQVFDDVRTVRAPNSEGSLGSYIWSAFRTTQLLKEYQRHNFVEHPKTSSILALTSMRKEGKAIEEVMSKLQSQSTLVNRHTGDIKKLQDDYKELKKKNPSLL